MKYIIDEEELVNLLAAYHYANCLDTDGVDNWSWYMEGKEIYLHGFESFEDLARSELEYYEKIED